MIKITYTSEICKPYLDGIKKCKNQNELLVFVETYWKELAYDALEAIKSVDFSWPEYEKGVKKEWRGKYSGDAWSEKYGAIILPAIILFIGLQAQHFCAPEGCVFIRLKEEGLLKMNEGGVYRLNLPKETESP